MTILFNWRWFWMLLVLLLSSILGSRVAIAGPKEQCFRMHNRLTGIPPATAALTSCVELVSQGKALEAAMTMTDNTLFFSETLRAVFTPWTTKAQDLFAPLSDFSVTAIGLAKDDADFRSILTGDVLYTCEGVAGLPAFSWANNEHYAACGRNRDWLQGITAKKQTDTNTQLQNKTSVPAGALTTRGFAAAYYAAGTNRAATQAILTHFLCEEMQAFHDTTASDYRVRQDVDRTPGGATKTYITECKGCHSGMDPLTGAFAHIDFNGQTGLVYDETKIAEKYFRNANTFPEGHRTTDDSWLNLWTGGANARVGWTGAMEGEGIRSLGEMIANSDQFGRCMAKHALKKVCVTEPDLKAPKVMELAQHFRDSGYKLKDLFAKTATVCMGE